MPELSVVGAIKRRRSGPEVRDRVAVRSAIAAVVGRFQSLQREVAFLNAALARPASSDELLPRVVALGRNVEDMFDCLDDVVATLAPEQRDHGRIRDLRRALEHLQLSVPRVRSRQPSDEQVLHSYP